MIVAAFFSRPVPPGFCECRPRGRRSNCGLLSPNRFRHYPDMAKTIITTDDLDGSPDAETISFSFAGSDYTIDLARKNKAAFEKALKPYLDAATSAGSGARRGSRSSSSSRSSGRRRGGVDTAAVRAWAQEAGLEVSERGRISHEVLEAYQAAH
jgi:hypothetical protein